EGADATRHRRQGLGQQGVLAHARMLPSRFPSRDEPATLTCHVDLRHVLDASVGETDSELDPTCVLVIRVDPDVTVEVGHVLPPVPDRLRVPTKKRARIVMPLTFVDMQSNPALLGDLVLAQAPTHPRVALQQTLD